MANWESSPSFSLLKTVKILRIWDEWVFPSILFLFLGNSAAPSHSLLSEWNKVPVSSVFPTNPFSTLFLRPLPTGAVNSLRIEGGWKKQTKIVYLTNPHSVMYKFRATPRASLLAHASALIDLWIKAGRVMKLDLRYHEERRLHWCQYLELCSSSQRCSYL